MDAQGLKLAQQEQPENVIDIRVGEDYAGDGRLAHAVAWMQFGGGFDLRAQVRGRSQQEPREPVLRDGQLRLRAGLTAKWSGAHSATV